MNKDSESLVREYHSFHNTQNSYQMYIPQSYKTEYNDQFIRHHKFLYMAPNYFKARFCFPPVTPNHALLLIDDRVLSMAYRRQAIAMLRVAYLRSK